MDVTGFPKRSAVVFTTTFADLDGYWEQIYKCWELITFHCESLLLLWPFPPTGTWNFVNKCCTQIIRSDLTVVLMSLAWRDPVLLLQWVVRWV